MTTCPECGKDHENLPEEVLLAHELAVELTRVVDTFSAKHLDKFRAQKNLLGRTLPIVLGHFVASQVFATTRTGHEIKGMLRVFDEIAYAFNLLATLPNVDEIKGGIDATAERLHTPEERAKMN